MNVATKTSSRKILGKIGWTYKNIIYPSFLWVIWFGSIYLCVGIIVFPSWWKRAIFDHAIFDPKFIAFAIHYLVDLFLMGHPLGVVLVILLFVAIGALVYHFGRISRRNDEFKIPCPQTKNLAISTVFVIGMLISLCFTGGQYKTPKEVSEFVEKLQDEAESPFLQMLHTEVKGPASGYFFYLDAPKNFPDI